jgi:hypothetical protein
MTSRFSAAWICLLVAGVAFAAAACSSAGASPSASARPSASPAAGVFPIIISREITVGRNRILFSFVDGQGQPIGAPDRTVAVRFTGPDGQNVEAPDGTFIWAIENVSGVYVTHADFPAAGAWAATFTTQAPESPPQDIPFSFDVVADAHVVQPGEPAPSVDTPTLDDVDGDVKKVSSDASPMPAFYETSVADALAAHEPFVLVFATPAFCKTETCGPTLEKVKSVAKLHADVTFINVEPYELSFVDGRLQPVLSTENQLQPVEATNAYGLLSEPFVFVVGGDGIVKASFELIFTPEEMDEALKALK